MGKKIEFPNANEAQNKILNQIADQKSKELKAKQDEFDEDKDKEEFLYIWKHFDDRLRKMLNDYKDTLQPKGYHGLVVTVRVQKKDSTDELKEQFLYSDDLQLFKVTEIE